MRIAIVGQQDFGKAILEAFLARGDTVAGVFCAPGKAGAKPDPLRAAAESAAIPVLSFASLKAAQAHEALQKLEVDLGIMAYVLQFVPQEFALIPRHGMIQYHPSLLPRYRGPSSINWPIIRGEVRTGISIFRPTDGLDEGPIILQRHAPIEPDDTLGSVYFEHLYPMGIAALQEAAELVVSGRAQPWTQDEAAASYEGWCRAPEARINWHNHVDLIYNLIRGCNPQPGAWTTFKGEKLQIFEAQKRPLRRYEEIRGPVGAVTGIGERSLSIMAQGGEIEVFKVRAGRGAKLPAPEFCVESGLAPGTILGE